MQIETYTEIRLIIDTPEDLKIWQTLFTRLQSYVNGTKPMTEVYKSTGSGYARRIEFTDDEIQMIDKVFRQITPQEQEQ